MALLQRALESVRSGSGQCVVIAGEAGIGKSRLVAEATTSAAHLGVTIAQGQCFESDRTLPFAPLIDLLQTFCARQSNEALASIFRSATPELIRLLPDLSALMPNITPMAALEPEQEKHRLFASLAQVLTSLGTLPDTAAPSQPGPILLIIEDIHWCDDTMLEFLHLFARRIAEYPLLLLLTYRSDEVNDSLRHFLGLLDRTRRVVDISLNRFDLHATREMISTIFDQQQPVRQEFVDALQTLTDGNPFFIEETLKSLVVSGDIYRVRTGWTRKQLSDIRIPRTITDAVQRRVQELSAGARQLLTLAAIAGRRFDLDLLADVMCTDEATLLAHIRELITAQLVVEHSDDYFAFRHALTRQAIYAQLLARERKPLHRALGEAIEQRYADKLESRAGDLAYHFYQAGAWLKASAYAQRAGERVQALFSPGVAIEYFTMALEAAAHAEMAAPASLYRTRGQLHELVGNFAAANADYRQALDLARAAHDQHAEWQSLFDLGFLWSARDHTQAGEYLRHALELACQLDDDATLAHTLYRLGNWHANRDQQAEALRNQQEALALFERLGDKRGLARTLDVLGMTSLLIGDMIAATTYQRRAIALFRELDDRSGLLSCLMIYAMHGLSYMAVAMACPAVDLNMGQRYAEEALQLARELGSRPNEAGVFGYFALVLGARGYYGRALEFAQQALDIAQEVEHPIWLIIANMTLGAAYHDLLELEVAQQHLERALQIARDINGLEFSYTLSTFLAPLYIARGELRRAEALIDTCVAALGTDLTTNVRRRIQAVYAEIHLARGQATEGLLLLDRIIAATPHAAVDQLSPQQRGREPRQYDADDGAGVIPYLWRLRGAALAALGRWPEARACLLAAAGRARLLDARPECWRIQVILGALLRSMRKSGQAVAAFDSARALIMELAQDVPEQDGLRERFTQRALATIPPITLTPLQQMKRETGGLTARERSVASLIAQGKNNREIAETLIISQRTVEVHVGNIMNKLHVTSRAQIAAWVATRGI